MAGWAIECAHCNMRAAAGPAGRDTAAVRWQVKPSQTKSRLIKANQGRFMGTRIKKTDVFGEANTMAACRSAAVGDGRASAFAKAMADKIVDGMAAGPASDSVDRGGRVRENFQQ